MDEPFALEPLGPEHDAARAAFSCGVEALDRYLRRQAGQEQRRRVAAVSVLREIATGAVAGYFMLSAASVEAAALPEDLARRLPKYPLLPALLIGRLAVDQRYRGQGLGGALLVQALRRCYELHAVGAIGVVGDAKDAAARAFYERYDFVRLPKQPYRLVIPMTTIGRL